MKKVPEVIGPGCQDCSSRLSEPDIYSKLYCREIKLDHDAKPDMRGFTGERATCISFDPNLLTAAKFKLADTRLLICALGTNSPII